MSSKTSGALVKTVLFTVYNFEHFYFQHCEHETKLSRPVSENFSILSAKKMWKAIICFMVN